MRYLVFLLLSLIMLSCESKEEGNEYLHTVNTELSPLKGDQKKVEKLYRRELEKYYKTGNEIFLISSKYVELALYGDPSMRLKQIPMVYDLLKLNRERYDYLTIALNYNLASHFEKSSPEWSMKCIDEAIEADEKTKKQYFLPHLFHFKGRIFYNKGDYNKAITYFNKALEIYKLRKDILFTASMHYNFGMCYDKMNNLNRAINENLKGINILEAKKYRNIQQETFLNYMKGGLAQYFLKKKNYRKAEQLIVTMRKFSFESPNYQMALSSSKDLIEIYDINHERNKIGNIIDSLSIIEPYLSLPSEKITLNELAQEYYANIDDHKNFGKTSKKLVTLNKEQNELTKKELKINFEIADNYIIKIANKQTVEQQRKNQLILISVGLLFIIFLIIIISLIQQKNKREKILTQSKIIAENEKKILEQNIELQQQKIRNLHLNLNLKTETEKAFLDNLKKIKKSKNIDTEEILKDLQFKINNLIFIDKKNNNVINESSLENRMFMEKLSAKFPVLSEQELKLCVYFKLRLSAKEISLLENLTVGSIRVYKAKIKAKMELGKETDLDSYLNDI